MKKAILILLFSQFCIAQHGIIWQKTLGGNQIDGFSSCIVGVDFGFLVGGTSNSGIDGDKNQVSRGSTDPWLIKFSENFKYSSSETSFSEQETRNKNKNKILM